MLLHYLGPPGTYSHQVAQKIAKRLLVQGNDTALLLQPCATITATLQDARAAANASAARTVSLALIPYENNSNGAVVDSHGLVHSMSDIRIVADDYLPVSHSLLASRAVYERLRHEAATSVSGGALDVKVPHTQQRISNDVLKRLDTVYSHPQALGQCSLFLDQYMRPGAARVSTTSTGEAARRLAKETPSTAPSDDVSDESEAKLEACIASAICAQPDVYGLVELFPDIQNSGSAFLCFVVCDEKNASLKLCSPLLCVTQLGNVTRFLLIEVDSTADGRSSNTQRVQALPRDTNRTASARAMFRLGSDDASAASPLSACLGTITAYQQDLASQNSLATPEVHLAIRKIDRHVPKSAGQEEAKTSGVASPLRAANGCGSWPCSYLVEVDVDVRAGATGGDESTAPSRDLQSVPLSAAETHLHQLGEKLKYIAGKSVEVLGIWQV